MPQEELAAHTDLLRRRGAVDGHIEHERRIPGRPVRRPVTRGEVTRERTLLLRVDRVRALCLHLLVTSTL